MKISTKNLVLFFSLHVKFSSQHDDNCVLIKYNCIRTILNVYKVNSSIERNRNRRSSLMADLSDPVQLTSVRAGKDFICPGE